MRVCLQQLERLEAQLHSPESTAALAEARGLTALRHHQPSDGVEFNYPA